MSNCLIPLTSDTALSCYQACSKRLAVTWRQWGMFQELSYLRGKGEVLSGVYQVTQQASGQARNGICICQSTVHAVQPQAMEEPLTWAKKQTEERDFPLEVPKCYSEKRKKVPLSCSIKPKPRRGHEEVLFIFTRWRPLHMYSLPVSTTEGLAFPIILHAWSHTVLLGRKIGIRRSGAIPTAGLEKGEIVHFLYKAI